jgi:Tol biopolymer transport system component
MLMSAAALSLSACGGSGDGGSTPAPGPGPGPGPAPRTAEAIAFVGRQAMANSSPEFLYAAKDNAQGQTTVSFTTSGENTRIYEFAFSPDGKWLAYIGQEANGDARALYVAPAAGGSAPVRVSQPSPAPYQWVSDFDWSPDSEQLVYSGNFDQPLPYEDAIETYVVDRDGANRKKVSGSIIGGGRPVVEVRNPEYSSGGALLLTEVAHLASGTGDGAAYPFGLNIYPVNTAPAGGFRLVEMPSGIVANQQWSPDGEKVCYFFTSGAPLFYIGVSDVAKGSANYVSLGDLANINSQCRWSADSDAVAYLDQTAVGGPANLVVQNADRSGRITVAGLASAGRTIGQFDWMPNSSDVLAYIADADTANVMELYVKNKSGGAATKINVSLIVTGDVLEFKWSPDRSKIAYLADAEVNGEVQLYVSGPGGENKIKISDFRSGEEVTSFDWSADSTRLVFSSGLTGGVADSLYVATADGSQSQLINTAVVAEVGGLAYAD